MNLPAKLFLLLVACIAIGIGVFITRKPGVSRVDWDSRTLEFHPTLKETVLTADFTFTNAGNRPVRIEDVKSGCGCTTALPDKKDYAPGEKGHITATFTIGERTGLQKILITVKFAGETPPVPLLLVAHIPVCMTVTPELLYWQIGDAPETDRKSVV